MHPIYHFLLFQDFKGFYDREKFFWKEIKVYLLWVI